LNGGGGSTGTVTKVLRDTRLVDPVHAEQLMTAMTDVNYQCLNVCDFAGRQVVQYRFGPSPAEPPAAKPVAPADNKNGTNAANPNGMGPDGKALFECMGVQPAPGNPIQTVNANCH